MIARSIVPLLAAFSATTTAVAELPSLVEDALATVVARAEPDQRWSFTRTVMSGAESFTMRYDPTRPLESAWTLLAPASADALSDDVRRTLEEMQAEETPDVSAFVGNTEDAAEAFVAGLGEAMTIVSEDAPRVTYAFQPVMEEGNGEWGSMGRHLSGELIVEKALPLVTSMRFFAPRSFKPAPVARIDSMDVTMRYGEVEPGGPIALLESVSRLSGSAFFRRIDQSQRVTHSDFVRVEAPAQVAE